MSQPDIVFQHVNKQYGNKSVLKDINLEISHGDFVAVVGRSGGGKSTLLRLISGLEQPTSGEIFINGRRLLGTNKESRMMFQDGRLLPWKKVIKNVGLGIKGDWKKVALETLGEVGLADRANEYPSVLSGGQKQRVALARALVANPRILLLDEPLGALDALTRLEMQSFVEKIWMKKQLTSILVTHDVEEAVTLANRVILIEEGRIAMDVDIDLPRPRRRNHPQFAVYSEKILTRVLNQKKPEEESYTLTV